MDQILEAGRWLLGVLILAANVAVWRGVYLENDRFPKETQDRGWRLLLIALASEAAFGFFLFSADTVIGLRQASQIATLRDRATTAEAKIAEAQSRAAEANQRAAEATLALERLKTPRNLSDEQKRHVVTAVASFSGTPFTIAIYDDPEVTNLLPQLEDALRLAGWVERPWAGKGDIQYTREGMPGVGSVSAQGVYVQADSSRRSEYEAQVMALAQALNDVDIAAKPEIGRMAPNTNNEMIQILIGRKP